jgi:4-hydroxybenzoate polyprenyltransferase
VKRILTATVDYGLLVACTAVVLLAAASHTLGDRPPISTLAMVFCGSWGVYLLDRLWDVARDRHAHPTRAYRFRSRPRRITAAAVVGVVVAGILGLRQISSVQILLVAVFLLSLAHHALKQVPWLKPTYIALSWWAVTVGIPILHHLRPGTVSSSDAEIWSVLPLGLAIGANVLACDAADRDAEAARLSPMQLWWIARGLATAGLLVSWGIGDIASLWIPIPACVLLSLLPFRPTAQWTASAVDGSLLVGGLLVLVWG